MNLRELSKHLPPLPQKLRVVATQLPLWALRVVTAAAALYYVWLFADLTGDRISYPGELEWMEGGVLAHVLRVLEGKPLYAEPSLEFTAFIYTPFYYWLCALLSPVFGSSVSLLRGVSSACFFSSLALIFAWSYRQNRSILPGLIGAGLFAATFRLGGAWFDIARTDTLLILLLLSAGFLLFCYKSKGTAIASGLLFCCAFLTKQSALLPLCAVAGWAVLTLQKRNFWFTGVAFGSTFLSWLTLHLTTDGWFSYYVFTVPSAHPLLDDWKLWFWQRDVLGVLAIPSFILLFEMGASALMPKLKWRKMGFLAFCCGVIMMAWSSRFHLGMYDNVLMPLHALMGLTVALALGRFQGKGAEAYRALEIAALLGVLGTLWNLEYPAEAQRPSKGHLAQHERLMKRFESSPKGSWAPYHSLPTLLAGNPARSHVMALIDIFRADPEMGKKLAQEAEVAIAEQRYPTIFWSRNDPSTAFLKIPLARHYRRVQSLRGPGPLTGWGQYITEVWVPRTPSNSPRRPRPAYPKRAR